MLSEDVISTRRDSYKHLPAALRHMPDKKVNYAEQKLRSWTNLISATRTCVLYVLTLCRRTELRPGPLAERVVVWSVRKMNVSDVA